MDVFGRTEATALGDAAAFERDLALPRVEDETAYQIRQAGIGPGEPTKQFLKAAPKRVPDTDSTREVFEALAHPVKLGYVSRAVVFSPALNRLRAKHRVALYNLVKGGALVVLRVGPPDDLWLAREAR